MTTNLASSPLTDWTGPFGLPDFSAIADEDFEPVICAAFDAHLAEIVAEKAAKLTDAMRAMGCSLNNAYMQHSLLALVVIPELRISDIGIIDVTKFEKVDLFL